MGAKVKFTINRSSTKSAARMGELRIGPHRIRTPLIWLGHSLRSGLNIREVKGLSKTPLIVSLGDTFHRPSLYHRVCKFGIHKHLASTAPIMMDSGGYKLLLSMESQFSVERAIGFFEQAGADITVSLDYPLSLQTSYRENRRRWYKSITNFMRTRAALPNLALMPVIHGLTSKQIVHACKTIEKTLDRVTLIGIGSLVPLLTQRYTGGAFIYNGLENSEANFIADAIKTIRYYFPSSFLHAFGVGSTTTALAMLALGVDSIDSSSWRIKAAYGKIHLPGMSDRYLRENRNARNDHPALNSSEKELLRSCSCPVCSEIAAFEQQVDILEGSFKSRAVHNAWVVLKEIAKFRSAISRGREIALVKSRVNKRHRLSSVFDDL